MKTRLIYKQKFLSEYVVIRLEDLDTYDHMQQSDFYPLEESMAAS